jgi:hypothetical protein
MVLGTCVTDGSHHFEHPSQYKTLAELLIGITRDLRLEPFVIGGFGAKSV